MLRKWATNASMDPGILNECLDTIERLRKEMFIKEDMMDFAEHISGKQVVNSELDAWAKRQKVK